MTMTANAAAAIRPTQELQARTQTAQGSPCSSASAAQAPAPPQLCLERVLLAAAAKTVVQQEHAQALAHHEAVRRYRRAHSVLLHQQQQQQAQHVVQQPHDQVQQVQGSLLLWQAKELVLFQQQQAQAQAQAHARAQQQQEQEQQDLVLLRRARARSWSQATSTSTTSSSWSSRPHLALPALEAEQPQPRDRSWIDGAVLPNTPNLTNNPFVLCRALPAIVGGSCSSGPSSTTSCSYSLVNSNGTGSSNHHQQREQRGLNKVNHNRAPVLAGLDHFNVVGLPPPCATLQKHNRSCDVPTMGASHSPQSLLVPVLGVSYYDHCQHQHQHQHSSLPLQSQSLSARTYNTHSSRTSNHTHPHMHQQMDGHQSCEAVGRYQYHHATSHKPDDNSATTTTTTTTTEDQERRAQMDDKNAKARYRSAKNRYKVQELLAKQAQKQDASSKNQETKGNGNGNGNDNSINNTINNTNSPNTPPLAALTPKEQHMLTQYETSRSRKNLRSKQRDLLLKTKLEAILLRLPKHRTLAEQRFVKATESRKLEKSENDRLRRVKQKHLLARRDVDMDMDLNSQQSLSLL
jgi:hypothetical protein